MSADHRAIAAKLARKYANVFRISIDDVVIRYWSNGDATISAPTHPELPSWDTGVIDPPPQQEE